MNIANAIRTLKEWLTTKSWDAQMKADSEAGRLDELREEALEDHRQGRDTEL